MDPNTQMTQEDFLTELTELSQLFGLYGENDNFGVDGVYIHTQPEMYICPWDNISRRLVLISTNIWTGSSTGQSRMLISSRLGVQVPSRLLKI
jgi:hypothetical protein